MTSLSCHSLASESAIDAYASRLLRLQSPQEAVIDPSVGPYVTSVIRSSLSGDVGLSSVTEFSLESMLEYDSLMELIQDHCGMEPDVSRDVLQRIALAVRTGVVSEYHESTPSWRSTNRTRGNSASFSYTSDRDFSHPRPAMEWNDFVNKTSIHSPDDAMHLGISYNNSDHLSTNSIDEDRTTTEADHIMDQIENVPIDQHKFCPTSHSERYHSDEPAHRLGKPSMSQQNISNTLYPTPESSTSIQKQDYLIPVDLLGVIEDESMRMESMPQDHHATSSINSLPSPMDDRGRKAESLTHSPTADCEDKSSILPGSNKTKGKKGKNKATDIAALLFKPSRPRSNSVQESKSSKIQTPSIPLAQSATSLCFTNGSEQVSHSTSVAYRQNLESTTQILLSLNPTICEEAAYEAVLVADTDIHLAQHVIDGALSAPPVCRHMLNDSCYRSDCQFSHDVDGHTCLFWLKGRCGKGHGCRFLHGFSQTILDGVKIDYLPNYFRTAAGIESVETAREPHSTVSTAVSNPIPQPIKTTNLVQHNMKNTMITPSSQRTVNRSGSFDFHSSMTPLRGTATTTNDSTPLIFQSNMWKPPSLDSISAYPTSSAEDILYNPIQEENRFSSTSSSRINSVNSFASIASKGYNDASFSYDKVDDVDQSSHDYAYVRIPQELWHSNHNRNSSAFQIVDPISRYLEVAQSVIRSDVIDLHFQSLRTFPIVLSQILPEKLRSHDEVWIVSGSGHHVNRNSHQKSGGILDTAVIEWLEENEYNFTRGKDKNGFGGAVLVKR